MWVYNLHAYPKDHHHLITYNLKTIIVIVTHHSLSVQMCSFILYSYYKTMCTLIMMTVKIRNKKANT